MRRIVPVLVLAVVGALFHLASPPTAVAAAPIVGQLLDGSTSDHDPVADTTIRLHADDGGAPGAVVATTRTGATGNFSLTPPVAGADYWVEVLRNARVRGGYVRDEASGPSSVQDDVAFATPVRPGTRLGRVWAWPSFVSGVVVSSVNGERLRGINVSTRAIDALGTVLHSDVTDANGFFRIPVFIDEFGLRVEGGSRGFENGWTGCRRVVVRTWGQACSFGAGRVGKIRLDPA